jgi:hypothetical protein
LTVVGPKKASFALTGIDKASAGHRG